MDGWDCSGGEDGGNGFEGDEGGSGTGGDEDGGGGFGVAYHDAGLPVDGGVIISDDRGR